MQVSLWMIRHLRPSLRHSSTTIALLGPSSRHPAWVYGAAFEVQPPRVVLCALACYAMLVLGVTLTRRLGVRYGIVFLVACMTVIYLFAYVSWTATPRASALSSG